jgi:hypothetical protein
LCCHDFSLSLLKVTGHSAITDPLTPTLRAAFPAWSRATGLTILSRLTARGRGMFRHAEQLIIAISDFIDQATTTTPSPSSGTPRQPTFSERSTAPERCWMIVN